MKPDENPTKHKDVTEEDKVSNVSGEKLDGHKQK